MWHQDAKHSEDRSCLPPLQLRKVTPESFCMTLPKPGKTIRMMTSVTVTTFFCLFHHFDTQSIPSKSLASRTCHTLQVVPLLNVSISHPTLIRKLRSTSSHHGFRNNPIVPLLRACARDPASNLQILLFKSYHSSDSSSDRRKSSCFCPDKNRPHVGLSRGVSRVSASLRSVADVDTEEHQTEATSQIPHHSHRSNSSSAWSSSTAATCHSTQPVCLP